MKGNQIKLSKGKEKMSPYELYKIGNPGWARDFNSEAIQGVLEMSEFLDVDDEDFKRVFKPEIEPKGGKIVIGQNAKRNQNNDNNI